MSRIRHPVGHPTPDPSASLYRDFLIYIAYGVNIYPCMLYRVCSIPPLFAFSSSFYIKILFFLFFFHPFSWFDLSLGESSSLCVPLEQFFCIYTSKYIYIIYINIVYIEYWINRPLHARISRLYGHDRMHYRFDIGCLATCTASFIQWKESCKSVVIRPANSPKSNFKISTLPMNGLFI